MEGSFAYYCSGKSIFVVFGEERSNPYRKTTEN